MAESRFYNSLVAGQYCREGKFKVYGKTLKPFSLLHSAQLDALESPLWAKDGEVTPEDIKIAAQICAADKPLIDFEKIKGRWDDAKELRTWFEYVALCAANPMLRDRGDGWCALELGAPGELIVASYLMEHLGLSEERAWSMPYGLARWYFETVREQKDGAASILSEELARELDAMNTPEAKAHRKQRDERAKWIIENIADPKTRFDYLAKNESGELPENWQEVANG